MCKVMTACDLYIQTGETPLFSASFNGHAAVVDLLLQNGADVSICDEVHAHNVIGSSISL